MSADKVIVGGEVKGDITSCKIESQVKAVEKNSAFSLHKTTTYMTYDVCNKNVVAEYRVPEFTGWSIFIGVSIVLIVYGIIRAASDF